jgi:hypothetical protein
MHSRFRATSVTLTALAALVALLVVPATLSATPEPGRPGRGFRLMARAVGAITINRVYCGLAATGEVCVDSLNSSTIGGGYWPKGSPQAYVFNSGLQAAGSVEAGIPGFTWSGDTTGAFFFDPKGTTQHGELVQPIWNSLDPSDRAAWPAAAMVPQGDAVADLFDVNLQGEVSASEGDVWTIAWDGNPGLNAGRRHPLGIAVETRGMGWNSPTFNDDIVYFIYTFYNITSADPNDYLSIRPGMREVMQELGVRFQSLNNAAFGVTIPTGGYSIENFYANFAADMDVTADAGENYSSVNLPFAMGYVYHDLFRGTDGGFVLPPDMGSAPFLNGYGFVGVKYLRSPVVDPDGPGGPLPAAEVGIKLFSNTVNGGLFNDPRDAAQLFRYLSGNINQALGDGGCNNGNPFLTRICYIKQDGHADMRFFQSSGPFTLAPGEFGSIVVGYVFASAVASPGCPTSPCASVLPGNALRLVDPGLMSIGGNLIDSLTGYRGYQDDGDGIVEQEEFTTVKGSLLAKALVAQLVFDNKFLLPAPPRTPEFFLVPGNDQVAVFWRPSVTEAIGDLYYTAASNPGTPASPNLLYDPNYRQFDVEGYRVYRGRVDNPSSLALLAQFDYAGTVINDYLGAVNPTPDCAPELGNETGCPVNYSNPAPGNAYTVVHANDIVSPLVQVKIGDRTLLGTGLAIILDADTIPAAGTVPPLEDGGVPFVYVDQTARNNLRYFYSVTAFDVNSIQSGPSSLESARVTKAVTPFRPASNYDNAGALDIGMFGRGVNMTAAIPNAPAINATTGVFSGPARPATGANIGFVGQFVAQVVTTSGEMSVRLDSMAPGSAYDNLPSTFWYTVISSAGNVPLALSVPHDQFNVPTSASGTIDGGPINGERAARYGGSTDYHLAGAFDLTYQGNYYTGAFGRGCVNGAPGFRAAACDYNGARWFDDSTEVFAHPTQGNNNNFANELVTNRTTAGGLAGVANVYEARSYHTRPNTYRTVEGVLGSIATAADYRVWWGANGTVDSVVDITHNVTLPFAANFNRGYSWGFLTFGGQSAVGSGDARPATLSVTDFGCVPPLKTYAQPNAHLGCAAGTTFLLENNLDSPGDFGPMRFGHTRATDSTVTPTTNHGFGMYIAGHIFLFEMNSATPTAPAAGTLWTMRSYVGSVNGGTGGPNATGGSFGAYSFTPQASPFTAVGATLTVAYSVTNSTSATTEGNLAAVHTVPDPYYVTNQYERTPSAKIIKFVNLPDQAIVRIYSTSGVLVRVLEHNSSQFSGSLDWDVRNRNNQVVASGVYFYHIESPSGARRVGRMTIVNFAQ